jgi:hypothetical protein
MYKKVEVSPSKRFRPSPLKTANSQTSQLNLVFIYQHTPTSSQVHQSTRTKMKTSAILIMSAGLAIANAMVARQAASTTLPPAPDTLQSTAPKVPCNDLDCDIHVSNYPNHATAQLKIEKCLSDFHYEDGTLYTGFITGKCADDWGGVSIPELFVRSGS